MTLKEKFKNVLKNHFHKGKEEELLLDAVDDDLEIIADNYAIEFAEWYRVKCILSSLDYHLTTKELLEMFKKEKGYGRV